MGPEHMNMTGFNFNFPKRYSIVFREKGKKRGQITKVAYGEINPEKTAVYGRRVDTITVCSPFWGFMTAQFVRREFNFDTEEIPFPKHARCRTRKRLIRLLMGIGESRKDAVWYADFAWKHFPHGGRNSANIYQDAWIFYNNLLMYYDFSLTD